MVIVQCHFLRHILEEGRQCMDLLSSCSCITGDGSKCEDTWPSCFHAVQFIMLSRWLVIPAHAAVTTEGEPLQIALDMPQPEIHRPPNRPGGLIQQMSALF